MKTYICDSCGEIIDDPYKVKMKEFYVGMDIDYGIATPLKRKRISKVHLCDDCFSSLYEIAARKKEGDYVCESCGKEKRLEE